MTERALLFTDLVESTALVERLGDERAAQLLAEHDRRARELLALHGGREIDRSDGFFLLFDTVADAARFALAYHEALAPLQLSARVGLHVGAVTLHANAPADVARGAKPLEVEGLAKPLAARVMTLSHGGHTLLSEAALQALGTPAAALGADVVLDDHGHYRLKGIADPIRLFGLGLGSGGHFEPPADTDKAYRVVQAEGLWRPVREVRHNLPAERDAFIGRSTELQALAQRLNGGARLVTVLGVGGTGKTRMVRRYALSWLGEWPGGVAFCDLSEARSLEGICFAVAMALEVPLGKDDPVLQLGHAIAARGRCLVILDNFEQVAALAPATLGNWLDRAAQASFVVTSRERLHLAGEELFAVEPLALHTDAVALFEARARSQRAAFRLDEANRAPVAEVVKLLDGLPLAIELAAARVRVLSPAQIVERLKNRFVLLAGARGAAARQATLKAAIDWSWELLAPFEQAALAQCSVFEGGFTLEAAEAVLDLSPWPDAPPAMDVVQSLVDKSLLRAWVPVEQARFDIDEPYFGMYLSVHEYAAAKLAERGGAAGVEAQRRHGLHFARLGSDEAVEGLYAADSRRSRGSLALEVDNLALACRRALERRDASIAVPTYRAFCEVLGFQGPFGLALSLGASVLDLPGPIDAPRLDAALALSTACLRTGRIDEARQVLERARLTAQSIGDRKREGLALAQLANLDREQGHMHSARAQMEAALAIHRETGNLRGQAGVLQNLGNLNDQQGSPVASRECHEQALAIYGRHLGGAVLLNGVAAEVVSVRDNEIRVVAPNDLVDGSEVSVEVAHRGRRTKPVKLTVVRANPAIFGTNQYGKGNAQARNEDGTMNGAEHAAARGSEVTLYTTGGGLMDLPVEVHIGGQPAEVIATRESATRAGVIEVLVRVPDTVAAAAFQPVVLHVGNLFSQPGVGLAIR